MAVGSTTATLKAQTFKAKERLTHLADRTFDRVVAKAKDPQTRRVAKRLVGEFRKQVTLLTREVQLQAKELERAAKANVESAVKKYKTRRAEQPSQRRTRRRHSQ